MTGVEDKKDFREQAKPDRVVYWQSFLLKKPIFRPCPIDTFKTA
jgi:hypothetical protein